MRQGQRQRGVRLETALCTQLQSDGGTCAAAHACLACLQLYSHTIYTGNKAYMYEACVGR